MDREKKEVHLKSANLKARERTGNNLNCNVSIVDGNILYGSKLIKECIPKILIESK